MDRQTNKKQTNRQTYRHADRNTSHPMRAKVTKKGWMDIRVHSQMV